MRKKLAVQITLIPVMWFAGITQAHQSNLIRTLRIHKAAVNAVAFSPDGKSLASGSADHTVRLWDAQTGRLRRTLRFRYGVLSVAFSPDGRMLAVGQEKEVQLLSARTHEPLHTFRRSYNVGGSVAFSSDGRMLASGGGNDTDGGTIVMLWNPHTGKQMHAWEQKDAEITSITFTPDNKRIAAGLISGDAFGGGVRVWDVFTGKLKHEWIEKDEIRVSAMAFSSDGKLCVTAGGYFEGPGRLSVWEVGSGKLKWARTFRDWGTSVALCPNRALIALGTLYDVGYEDKPPSMIDEVKVWNVQTGDWKYSLGRHHGCINAIAFSPDGKLLATASSDKTVKLWRFRW